MATALITGAGTAIGQATACALAPAYDLVLCDRNVVRLEQTKSYCLELRPQSHIALWPYDLTTTASLEADFTSFLSSSLPSPPESISKFVHCACGDPIKQLHAVHEEDFLKCFRLHCVSAGLIIKTLIGAANHGALNSVVLTAEPNHPRTHQGFGFYQASKMAVETMARALALELEPTVRVNVVKPGLVQARPWPNVFVLGHVEYQLGPHTESAALLHLGMQPGPKHLFKSKLFEAKCRQAPEHKPPQPLPQPGWGPGPKNPPTRAELSHGRLAQPQDIAPVIAFLLSDAARMVTGEAITGEVIIVDSGNSIDGSIRMRIRP